MTMSTARTDTTVREIASIPGWRAIGFRELWTYRELLYILVWRDVKVRYKQTLLGLLWVMGQPLITMLIFTFLFHRVAKFDAGATPYAVFVLAGLLPWNLFSNGATNAGNSLIGHAAVISKIYFPRLLIPIGAVLVALVDAGVNCLLVAGLMAWYGVGPSASAILLPLIIVLAFAMSLGTGLWIAALNVKYRDVRIVFPFVVQIAMYATPVVYPLHVLPERYQSMALLNPMAGVVEGFRSTLLGTPIAAEALAWSIIVAVLLLASGALYFRKVEKTFADLL